MQGCRQVGKATGFGPVIPRVRVLPPLPQSLTSTAAAHLLRWQFLI